jgi:hypothetical protein
VGEKTLWGLEVDKGHLKETVLEQYENPDLLKELEDVNANELLEMQKKVGHKQKGRRKRFLICNAGKLGRRR